MLFCVGLLWHLSEHVAVIVGHLNPRGEQTLQGVLFGKIEQVFVSRVQHAVDGLSDAGITSDVINSHFSYVSAIEALQVRY